MIQCTQAIGSARGKPFPFFFSSQGKSTFVICCLLARPGDLKAHLRADHQGVGQGHQDEDGNSSQSAGPSGTNPSNRPEGSGDGWVD